MSFVSRRRRESAAPLRRPQLERDEAHQLFRRSRTLTGSTSSAVVSASEGRSRLRSPRLRVQDLARHRRIMVAMAMGSFVTAGGLLWLLDQYIVTAPVAFVTPETSRPAPLSTYQEIADEYLASRPLERFRFWLRPDALTGYMSSKNSEIDTVDLTNRSGLVSHTMTVALKRPLAKWQLGNAVYYVDGDGKAFRTNYYNEPSVIVDDQSGLPIASQQVLASSQLLSYIGRVVREVDRQQVGTVKRLIIPPAALKEIDVVLEGREYRLKFSTDRGVVGQVADAKAALRHIDQLSKQPRYIDLRIAGRAYYLE